MQPLSSRVRTAYLILFIFFFTTLIPFVIMYAEGWRFSSEIGFYKTGGIYVTVPYNGATVALEGRVIGQTGLLQRSFYIDDLAPATYVLRATFPGSHPWERMVVVEPQIVTDTRALLPPLELEIAQLVTTGTTTGTRIVSRATLEEYNEAFATTTSSVQYVDRDDNVGLYLLNGNLIVRWLDTDKPFSSNFCMRPSACVTEYYVENGSDYAVHGALFFDGVVYATKEGGVFFTELDVRPTPRVIPLFATPEAEFRIIDDALIVKDGEDVYEISL